MLTDILCSASLNSSKTENWNFSKTRFREYLYPRVPWNTNKESPKFAFIFSVHGGVSRARELSLEVFRVAERSDYPELAGGVRVGEDLAQQGLRGLYLAPHLGVRDEEHLLRSELSQAWQGGLRPEALHGPGVGPERLPDAAIVRDIFSLRVSSIQLKYF